MKKVGGERGGGGNTGGKVQRCSDKIRFVFAKFGKVSRRRVCAFCLEIYQIHDVITTSCEMNQKLLYTESQL